MGSQVPHVAVWSGLLRAQGWGSWAEAIAWAQERDGGWRDIATRLGTTAEAVRRAALAEGLVIVPRRARILADAAQYVAEHGSLDGTEGELASAIVRFRADERAGGLDPEVAEVLDGLDPRWRLTEAERTEHAKNSKETYVGHRQRRSAREWATKLASAGWADWGDALAWAYSERVGLSQIAARCGATDQTVWKQIAQFLTTEEGQRLQAASMQSRPGDIAEVDERLQCPECGLWFTALRTHVRKHGVTAEEFRATWELPPDARLGTILSGRAAGTITTDDAFDTALATAGYASLTAAVNDAHQHGEGIAQLAVRLGVHHSTLRGALKQIPGATRKLTGPTKRERMLNLAQETAAAGLPLAAGPQELRIWMYAVRARVKDGKPSPTARALDRIDPNWIRTADEQTAGTDTPSPVSNRARMEREAATALTAAGFNNIDDAAHWAQRLGAGITAIELRTGISRERCRILTATKGIDLHPDNIATHFIAPLTAATAHIRAGHTLANPPAEITDWLTDRRTNTDTNSWVNAYLDDLDPTWRNHT